MYNTVCFMSKGGSKKPTAPNEEGMTVKHGMTATGSTLPPTTGSEESYNRSLTDNERPHLLKKRMGLQIDIEKHDKAQP